MFALTEVLTQEVAGVLIKEILAFLRQKQTSTKDKEELKKNITKLVNLA